MVRNANAVKNAFMIRNENTTRNSYTVRNANVSRREEMGTRKESMRAQLEWERPPLMRFQELGTRLCVSDYIEVILKTIEVSPLFSLSENIDYFHVKLHVCL